MGLLSLLRVNPRGSSWDFYLSGDEGRPTKPILKDQAPDDESAGEMDQGEVVLTFFSKGTASLRKRLCHELVRSCATDRLST